MKHCKVLVVGIGVLCLFGLYSQYHYITFLLNNPPNQPVLTITKPTIPCDLNNTDWNKTEIIRNDSTYFTSRIWMPTQTAGDIHVYSAYYYTSDDGIQFIRVLGVGQNFNIHNVVCAVQMYTNSTCLQIWKAKVLLLPESHGTKYSALYVDCEMKRNQHPYAVSVIQKGDYKLKNRLLVQYPRPLRYNLTTCFACLHSKYDDRTEAIQTIEMDQILGVQHFVVYNYSVGATVRKVLKHYEKQGILEIRSWNVPDVTVHYYGQLVSINDCLYSNRGLSKYVIVKDMDELIVPYKDKDLTSFVAKVTKDQSSTASILFRHTYFGKKWADDLEKFEHAENASELGLYTLMKVWRGKEIYPPSRRSKVIYRPEVIHIAGIHFEWKIRKGFKRIEVNPIDGLLHHYRNTKDSKDTKVKQSSVRRFSTQLIENFIKTSKLIDKQVYILTPKRNGSTD